MSKPAFPCELTLTRKQSSFSVCTVELYSKIMFSRLYSNHRFSRFFFPSRPFGAGFNNIREQPNNPHLHRVRYCVPRACLPMESTPGGVNPVFPYCHIRSMSILATACPAQESRRSTNIVSSILLFHSCVKQVPGRLQRCLLYPTQIIIAQHITCLPPILSVAAGLGPLVKRFEIDDIELGVRCRE